MKITVLSIKSKDYWCVFSRITFLDDAEYEMDYFLDDKMSHLDYILDDALKNVTIAQSTH